ncbi:serine hydrolase domain-containing protein [Levilactobacillus brevis]|uniref:serine hydrolase domain-containing protein n=1 Tax=Levilactobacillus brevis TaxID=1580 RepID=UPI00063AC6A6|nr:serine hydrolase domain-containing protein [Levilactobacillus brevis]KLE29859.1 beta-lactamase [Levilactobacillus brevis]MCT3569741.1 serine hydrolase [Levilactobacillus brevis]MCT3578410.1 serine hydrolase [Levilactobacillus brevis]MDM5045968.1 serine hydrolase domain-containing protein [Levilactobacillus brevis]
MTYPQTKLALHRLVTDGVVPGVSYSFIDGDRVETGVIGQAALVPQTEPLRPGMLYDVASLTKVVGTLSVVLQLLAQGRLHLTDLVSDWLPQWQDSRVTIQHLLTHTSGITGYIPHRDQLAAPELTAALLKLHVGPTFNRQMVYADVNYIFLGWIVEQILQQPIQTVAQQRVLTPLGMQHSTFTPTNAEQCVPTAVTAERGVIRGMVHDPKGLVLQRRCGSAGLFSTVADLTRFCQAYLRPEAAATVLPPQWVHHLLSDWTPTHQAGRSLGWALTTAQWPTAHRVIWHSGFTGAYLVIDPLMQQAMVFLTNRVHPIAPNEPYLDQRNAVISTYLAEKSRQ